ncbi:fatty acid desaturase [Zavarzinia compransoris]|uniref:Uncharacterized protein n=1 Tax=Zavarzinia compransoris TaxID=1264899 RepID=A0A317E238_9PROT|nr:fatty acid desaturase [Zavarzinia compransoris]PWR21049.1 hypothetical protein DKG75_13765 [Zavarzinia compransoris]TDP44082.1 vanillate O-demethylase ferredoxin subunit [Zavarzinia compransoris]
MEHQATADWGLVARARATERLQDLHRLPLFPVPTIGLTLACLLGFALSAWGMVTGQLSPYVGVPVSAIIVYASFTVLHDGTHRAISRSPLVNDIIGTIGGQILLPGLEVAVYRHLHLEHHKNTGHHTEDPDDILVRPLPGSLPQMMFIDVVWFFWYMKRIRRWTAVQNARFLFGFTLYVLWHAAWIASPWGGEWFLVWLLPQRLGLTILTYLFAHIQHPPGVEQDARPIHATVMLDRNPLVLSFMLGQSAHLIHHLYPQLPFYRLEAGWRAAEALLRPRNVHFRSLFDGRYDRLPGVESHWLEAKVAAVEDIAADIRLFTLVAPDGGALPPFEAGAHIDVRLGPSLVRQYSLIGRPGAAGPWRIAVKRDGGGRGGSIALHQQWTEGAEVTVGRPRNNFALAPGGTRLVLVAGGIGLTPLLSMAHAAAGRDLALHVFARDRAHMPFGGDFSRFPFAGRVTAHQDHGQGFSDAEIMAALGPRVAGDRLYLCGPQGFMARVKAAAARLGWPEDGVATESFAADAGPGRAFTLALARSGRRFEIPAGTAITDVLDKARLPVDTLCRRGICGTCRCRLVSGTVEHRDMVLTAAERAEGQFIPCVSRGTGADAVVLDL